MNFESKKILSYSFGVLVIALWAIFHVLSYEIAMILTSVVLIGCFAIEAQEAKKLHRVVSYRIRIGAISLLSFALLMILIKSIF